MAHYSFGGGRPGGLSSDSDIADSDYDADDDLFVPASRVKNAGKGNTLQSKQKSGGNEDDDDDWWKDDDDSSPASVPQESCSPKVPDGGTDEDLSIAAVVNSKSIHSSTSSSDDKSTDQVVMKTVVTHTYKPHGRGRGRGRGLGRGLTFAPNLTICMQPKPSPTEEKLVCIPPTETATAPKEDWDWEPGSSNGKKVDNLHYKHPLPMEKVFIVDSWEKAEKFHQKIVLEENNPNAISGFDTEWKPIRAKMGGIALMQVAFQDQIFLIDIVSLKEFCPEDESALWTRLRKNYFENEKITKIGFDCKNDTKMLGDTVCEWKNMNDTWKSMVDLAALKTMIHVENPTFFEKYRADLADSNSVKGMGLDELVYTCLGKSLSKNEQMSNWEKRPLREAQVQYASSDAYCLIEVYLRLMEMCRESGVNVESYIETHLKPAPTKKITSFDTVLELLSKPYPDQYRVVGDQSCVKFVVDTMLQGLGRHLRACGFDTVILDNNSAIEDCYQYARKGRTVITRGIAYSKVVQELSAECAYNVKADKSKEQVREICNYFKIVLSPQLVFTICQRCNESEFIKVSRDTVRLMLRNWGIKAAQKRKNIKPLEACQLIKGKLPDDMIMCVGDVKKGWTLLDANSLKLTNEDDRILTEKGVVAELPKLQAYGDVINWVYVCNNCGKCYWESEEVEKLVKETIYLNKD